MQRKFRDFGDQWNFALEAQTISAKWTMKLDPDERLTPEFKSECLRQIESTDNDAFYVNLKLFFMGKKLPVSINGLRLWRTGKARMSKVAVNEHLLVDGPVGQILSFIEHHDSPDLDHWCEKQNRYTTAEAMIAFKNQDLADVQKFWGTKLQRRMWIKKRFWSIPFRYQILFLYHYLYLSAWKSGWVGYVWSRLRSDVYRYTEYKFREMCITQKVPTKRKYGPGKPDPRLKQFE